MHSDSGEQIPFHHWWQTCFDKANAGSEYVSQVW